MTATDLTELDALGQAQLVHSGDVSPRELVDAAIACIEEVNPGINAVIHERFEAARSECPDLPDGPFRGVPLVLKDTALAAGEPVHVGMRVLREAGYRSPADQEFVARFRRAGFVVVGRTNTPELANQATTEPRAYGATRNPWDPTRSVGGSSGGSAAAVAARMVPVGHGNDGGGSIRIPASVCGLVGLKASRGRISVAPLPETPGSPGVEGALCRSVRDAAAVLDVLAGPMAGDPHTCAAPAQPFRDLMNHQPNRLRIAVMTEPPGTGLVTDPAISETVALAACALDEFGHDVGDGVPPLPPWERIRASLADQWSVHTAALVASLGAASGARFDVDDLEPTNAALVRRAEGVTAAQVGAINRRWATTARRVEAWWAEGNDLLLTPTVRTQTPRIGELVPESVDPLAAWTAMWDWIPFTPMWNILGNPAISLPVRAHDGLPIGVQLVARCGREDLLLQVAAQLEAALPPIRQS